MYDQRRTPGGSASTRILIVDDDQKFAGVTERVLSRVGYQCLLAVTGNQALRLVREEQPDAVVLDVMIPPPDGLEVCHQLRRDGWAGGVVVVTARHGQSDQSAALEAGADAFLRKPFPLDDLVTTIAPLTRGPQ